MQLDKLPTPVAKMVDRVRRSEQNEPLVQFDAAWLLCEVIIKYVTILALSLLSKADEQRAHRQAYQLVRGDSIGAWTSTLHVIARRLAKTSDEACRKLARRLTRRIPYSSEPEHHVVKASQSLAPLLATLNIVESEDSVYRRPNLLSLFDHLATVRNKTRGHGAFTPAFYKDAAPLLKKTALHLVELIGNLGRLVIITHYRAEDGQSIGLWLEGSSPTRVEPFAAGGEPGTIWFIPSGSSSPVQVLPLMFIDLSTFATSFINGNWSENTSSVAILNYENGQEERRTLIQYKLAATPPPSSTEGGSQLVWESDVAHNLPDPVERYVNRPRLEETLLRLLRDPVHRLVSLNGPGGSGKTSLALRVCHELRKESPFDIIVWVSARDVDLLLEGPAPRERQVKDLDSFAKYLCTVLEIPFNDEDKDAVSALSTFFATTKVSCLIVVDNLETLDDPLQLQRFLDENVRMPSKVLITSRHERFEGDYPVLVRGMEEDEARELVAFEARQHYCEGRMTEQVVRRILSLSNRIPYVIKLMVAQFAHIGNVDLSYDSIVNHDELLSALFDRSFELLSGDGQFLYLLLSQIGEGPEWLLDSVCELIGIAYQLGRKSLIQHSLATVTQAHDEDGDSWLGVSHLVARHGSKMLVGHELESDVIRAVEVIRSIYNRFSHERYGIAESLRALWAAIAEGRAIGYLSWNEALDLGRCIASRRDECWLSYAIAVSRCRRATKEGIRATFKMAVETLTTSGEVWKAFSDFEFREGNAFTAAVYGARAIDCGYDNLDFALHIAGLLARELSRSELGVKPVHREMYVAGVVQYLEEQRQRLNATGLSRLGWLYFIRDSHDTDPKIRRWLMEKALDCAEDGLRLEPTNEYCIKLRNRVLTAMQEIA